jgi:DNA-binding LacI/PurR family transcriptional regulator
MVTIDDVAKKAGVSKSSVSRVLNGNFRYMSEKMRRKILDAIEELNYTPNSLARSLKTKETRVIGIILSDISNPFWSEILKGAQDEANRQGYGLMVTSSNDNPELEKSNIMMLKSRQVEGIIVNTIGDIGELFRGFGGTECPLVLLDRTGEEVKADTVVVNNVNGARQAVEHLIGLGHRRIGILLNPLENKSPRIERLKGYRLAHEENGMTVDESLVKICSPYNGSGVKATEQLLALPDRPTAIFTTNERLNLEALAGVKKAGFSVPDQVSIFGYDDFPWVPLLDPPLSTVAQPAYEMGVTAVTLLLNRLKDKGETEMPPQVVQLEPTVIIRNSCRPPFSHSKS